MKQVIYQCCARTLKGTRCLRVATTQYKGWGYCDRHYANVIDRLIKKEKVK